MLANSPFLEMTRLDHGRRAYKVCVPRMPVREYKWGGR